MHVRDFVACVEGDVRFRPVDMVVAKDAADDCFVVFDETGKYYVRVPVGLILEAPDWAELRGILAGSKDPAPLYHVSRIVGYFSRIENWNQSKIGELKDRRAGTYGIG